MPNAVPYAASIPPSMALSATKAYPDISSQTPLNILLVEDVGSDELLLRIALKETQIPSRLHVLQKGEDVLPWLAHTLKTNPRYLPDVMMLDLGLPRVNGFEILEDLAQAAPLLRALPIIILTGYGDFDYMRGNFNLWIPAYLSKPCSASDIREVLGRIYRTGAKSSV